MSAYQLKNITKHQGIIHATNFTERPSDRYAQENATIWLTIYVKNSAHLTLCSGALKAVATVIDESKAADFHMELHSDYGIPGHHWEVAVHKHYQLKQGVSEGECIAILANEGLLAQ